jgi:hypothetical protein
MIGFADLATRMDDHELSAMGIAEVVGESFPDVAGVTCRDGRRVARGPTAHDRHKQIGLREQHQDDDEPDDCRYRYQHALAA